MKKLFISILDTRRPRKPSQPKLQKFPINSDIPSRKTKSLSPSWYLKFPWLEYDVKADVAFCLHVNITW